MQFKDFASAPQCFSSLFSSTLLCFSSGHC